MEVPRCSFMSRTCRRGLGPLFRAVLLIFILGFCAVVFAQAPLPVYTDLLVSGFQDWGWATHDYANTSPVHSGANSVSVTINSGYAGLQMWHSDMDSSPYTAVTFWANGGASGGQRLQVYGLLHIGSTNNAGQTHLSITPLPTNSWRQYTVPLSSIGVANKPNFTGFAFQDTTGGTQPTFYLDDIQLVPAPAPAVVHLSVNATQYLRGVDSRWFGVNTATWDSNFDSPNTISALKEMGNRLLRGPGGSLSDEYHWSTDTNLTNTWRWATSFSNLAHVATNVGAQAMITVNYGTGSSNEAAAWVAYANAMTTNTMVLGTDQFAKNWQSAGYWAALRGASPLGTDDGKNFLRLRRSAPFGFKYWEIGNECYGGWETDSNSFPHDASTYAQRARDYFGLMKAVDPTIKIGVVVAPGEDTYTNVYSTHPIINPRTGQTHYGWTPVLLATLKGFGVTPDFVIHHRYPEYTSASSPAGADSDAALLQCSAQWALDAADLRQQISDYFGSGGQGIELLCTENNSDAGAQGRQSTSLVNGLYYADSLAQLMKTEFNGFVWWDLRNGTDTQVWFDSSLYGWRTYGDLGMINGLNTKHPTFYAAKLMQYFVQAGDNILPASSDYPLLSVYASRLANGAVNVLLLNKDTQSNFNGQINISGFTPHGSGTVRSFGIPQDEAARTNASLLAQDLKTNTVSGLSGSFTTNVPPLSMTLITFPPAAPALTALGSAAGQFSFRLQGQPEARYFVQSSTDLINWSTALTNSLTASTGIVTNTVPGSSSAGFWRAVWQP